LSLDHQIILMKRKLTTASMMILALLFCLSSFATTPGSAPAFIIQNNVDLTEAKLTDKVRAQLESFVNMTPKDFKKMTGKKLSLTEVIKLKVAQKKVKKHMLAADGEEKFSKTGYIILVILGLGFIPIGILTDWKGNDWWINLLLSLACWLPGVIHGLVTMKKYYN
jgi:uncharacterized membrane protein YqaE (UPF0057 family)